MYDACSDSLLDLGDRAHDPWYTDQRTACRSRFSPSAVCYGTQAARASTSPVKATYSATCIFISKLILSLLWAWWLCLCRSVHMWRSEDNSEQFNVYLSLGMELRLSDTQQALDLPSHRASVLGIFFFCGQLEIWILGV